jgi:hypothetical protein
MPWGKVLRSKSFMRVVFAANVVERGPQLPIQPVSFGFVAEDGRELYVINEECLSNVVRNPWASMNLLPSLPINVDIAGPNGIHEWDRSHDEYPHVFTFDAMARYVSALLTSTPDLELWSYYGSLGHVALCQLFGSFANVPAGIPLYYNDLQQEMHRRERFNLGLPELPPLEVSHHAMWDARWNLDVYNALYQVPETEKPPPSAFVFTEPPRTLAVELGDGVGA